MPPDKLLHPFSTQLKVNLTSPVLAPLLANRTMSLAILAAALVHTGLVLAGWPGWPCPVRTWLGLPCPGCGLSRACAALLRGEWQESLTFHAFAPFFLVALALMVVAVCLPPAPRRWLINQVELVERQTGLTALLLVGLVFYWLIRLVFFRAAFINLIIG